MICDYYIIRKLTLQTYQASKKKLEIFTANTEISFTFRIRKFTTGQTKSLCFPYVLAKCPNPLCFPCTVGTLTVSTARSLCTLCWRCTLCVTFRWSTSPCRVPAPLVILQRDNKSFALHKANSGFTTINIQGQLSQGNNYHFYGNCATHVIFGSVGISQVNI